MKYLKKLVAAAGLIFMCMASHAEHAAVAYAEGGGWGWGVKSNPKDAEIAALKACREFNPGKKCAVEYVSAISRAEGDGRIGFDTSSKSKIHAEKKALEHCADPSCKVVWTKATPGFYAVYASISEGEVVEYYLQHGSQTGSLALEEGKKFCEKQSELLCEVKAFGAIKGNFALAKTPVPAKPQPVLKSCRPNTPTIRCSSQCYNGDCTITYENGCKMRVQIRPQFNGASWVYGSPSC